MLAYKLLLFLGASFAPIFADHVKYHTGCRTSPIELVFAIDDGIMTTTDGAIAVKAFMKNIVQNFDVSELTTRVSLANNGDPPRTVFDLDSFNDVQSVEYGIEGAIFNQAGEKSIGRLLRHIRREVVSKMREESTKIVVFVGHGSSDDDTSLPSLALRSNGVSTIAVILEDDGNVKRSKVNLVEEKIWSKLYQMTDLREIGAFKEAIVDEICRSTVQACLTTAHDIAMVIDTDAMVTKKKFKLIKSWMKNVIKNFNVGENFTQVSVVHFTAPETVQDFKFNDHLTREDLMLAIDNIKYETSYRRTAEALTYLKEITFDHGNGSRHNARRSVILITDGVDYNKINDYEEADELKNIGVDVYVVGLSQFELEEANLIASDPDAHHVMTSPTYEDIYPLSTKLTNEICRKSEQRCPQAAVDIVFLIDRNLGITDPKLSKTKLMVKRVADSFLIDDQFARVAVVQYDGSPQLVFSLSAYDNIHSVLHAIDRIRPSMYNQPYFGSGLEFAINVFGDARGGVSKFLVIIGSGGSMDDVTSAVKLANEENIGVYAYNVGAEVSDNYLKAVNGNMDKLIHGTTIDEISWKSGDVVSEICHQSEPKCANHEVDIHFLVDGSEEMTMEKFDKARDWITSTVSSFDIGRYTTRIGLSQFSSRVHPEFLFNDYKTGEEIEQAISEFEYRGVGVPKLGKALKYVTNYIFTLHGGAREGTPKILVVISDTHSYDDIEEGLRKIRRAGIKTFIVGSAGFNTSIADLLTNETGGNHVIEDDFNAINLVRKGLVNDICQQTYFACPEVEMDLIFLIDGSSSIKPSNFEHAKEWMLSFIREFEIGDYNSNIGVIQYNGDPYIEINVTKFTNKNELIQAVQDLTYLSGGTRTGAALEFAREIGFPKDRSGRGQAPKVIIVLTDGASQDNVIPPAKALRKDGVILYAVGVGDEIDVKELEYIASTPISSSVYHVKNYESVSSIKSSLVRRVCQKVETDCKETATDMVIVVDGSNSVGYEDWEIMKSFMRNVTERFTIGPDTVRVGVVQYATYPKTEFTMSDNQNITSLAEAIDRIEWMKGDTHTAEALRYARTEALTKAAGARSQDVPKILIVVTDGDPQDSLEVPAAAEAIFDDGWRVFAIGVGQATISELNVIASDPDSDHVFYADNFEDTRKLKGRLFRMICSDYELIQRPKTPNGSIAVIKNTTDPTITVDSNLKAPTVLPPSSINLPDGGDDNDNENDPIRPNSDEFDDFSDDKKKPSGKMDLNPQSPDTDTPDDLHDSTDPFAYPNSFDPIHQRNIYDADIDVDIDDNPDTRIPPLVDVKKNKFDDPSNEVNDPQSDQNDSRNTDNDPNDPRNSHTENSLDPTNTPNEDDGENPDRIIPEDGANDPSDKTSDNPSTPPNGRDDLIAEDIDGDYDYPGEKKKKKEGPNDKNKSPKRKKKKHGGRHNIGPRVHDDPNLRTTPDFDPNAIPEDVLDSIFDDPLDDFPGPTPTIPTGVPEVVVRSFTADRCPTSIQYNGEELHGWDLLQEFQLVQGKDIPIKPKRSVTLDSTQNSRNRRTIKIVKGSTADNMAYRVSPKHELTTKISNHIMTSLQFPFLFSAVLKMNGKVQKEYITLFKVNDETLTLALDGINKAIAVTLPTSSGPKEYVFKNIIISKLYDKKFHKLDLLYKNNSVALFIDCAKIEIFADVTIVPDNGPYSANLMMSSNSRTPNNLFIDLQSLRLKCDLTNAESCCDIPGKPCVTTVTKNIDKHPTGPENPQQCICPPGPRGPPGQIPRDFLKKIDKWNETQTINYCLDNTSFQALIRTETAKAVKDELRNVVEKFVSAIEEDKINFQTLKSVLQQYLL